MANATVTVNVSIDPSTTVPFQVVANQMPRGEVGKPYPPTALVSVSGGVPPYSVNASGLPPGLSCDAAGLVTGTPTVAGPFTAQATGVDSQP